MSREIKFRAWDKDLCKYVTGAEFGLARMEIKPDEEDGHTFSFDTLFPGRYKWEQDTGFKDKNGKEICEGDIASVDGYAAEGGRVVVVVFDNGAWVGKCDGLVWNDLAQEVALNAIEVIGNINENPELLEGEE